MGMLVNEYYELAALTECLPNSFVPIILDFANIANCSNYILGLHCEGKL